MVEIQLSPSQHRDALDGVPEEGGREGREASEFLFLCSEGSYRLSTSLSVIGKL